MIGRAMNRAKSPAAAPAGNMVRKMGQWQIVFNMAVV